MKKKLGLTLIELLAVIAIIAILFILLVPQITKAIDKSRVSGVQVDLHSYEVGMRAYFMEHFGEEKTPEKLNEYLDKSLQFEEVDGEWVSKVEENPYKVKYELTSDNLTYMQVNSYTDEKNHRIHAVRVYEEGNEVKSKYIGFDDDKLKSEVDNEKPVISISPDGGKDVETVFVEVTDNNEVFQIQYVWSTQEKLTNAQWNSIENNTELSTVFLGRGLYYLHIKASDLDMNVAQKSSKAFEIGDLENPIITVTVNGSDEEKIQHVTGVSATDNKGIAKLEYAWSDVETHDVVNTPWTIITNGTQVSTPDTTGGFFLHIKATDISGIVTYFVSNKFNTGDTQDPIISLSVNGSETEKDEHTTVVTVTDNDEVHSIRYKWTTSSTKPTSGEWTTTTNGATLKTPTMNATLYLHVEARDRSGNKGERSSQGFKTGDSIFPIISLSPNGNNVYSTSHSTKITATDNKGIKIIEYVWSESEVSPSNGWTTTTSGAMVNSTPSAGDIYLYVRAEDAHGNVTKFKSNPFTQGFYEYVTNSTSAIITKYVGNEKDLIIPNTLGGKPVTVIDDGAFKSMGITSVVFPETIKEIRRNAFGGNELTNVHFPDSLTTLGYGAFTNNNLTSVTIPKNLTSYGNLVFAHNLDVKEVINCSKISSVVQDKFSKPYPPVIKKEC